MTEAVTSASDFGEEELSDEGSSQLTNSSDEEEVNWISWFVSLKGNEYFCEIEEDYIQDDFNLTGLSIMVPFYDYALDMMLDIEIPSDKLTEDQLEIPVLPIGISDTPRNHSVNTFCPKCRDVFYPKSARQANLDGSYFGTTFAHLFLLVHANAIPSPSQQVYVPRIFGFKIHSSSSYWKAHGKGESIAGASGASRATGRPRAENKNNGAEVASAASLPPPPMPPAAGAVAGGAASSLPAPPK
eukprot:GSChrysophyteH2.ASY1.ANO1.1745.1 assembled CDS